ncbi:MAG: hypothetical protein ACFFER_04970 [Candidatus Thorarchaeota archaeon]
MPTADTMKHPFFPWKDTDDRWLGKEIQTMDELEDAFPDLFPSCAHE